MCLCVWRASVGSDCGAPRQTNFYDTRIRDHQAELQSFEGQQASLQLALDEQHAALSRERATLLEALEDERRAVGTMTARAVTKSHKLEEDEAALRRKEAMVRELEEGIRGKVPNSLPAQPELIHPS